MVDKIYNAKKRKSCIPQLIENKRKHLERNLSATQQDQIMFKEARDSGVARVSGAQGNTENWRPPEADMRTKKNT